jgi:hypothetical protein
MHLWRLGHRSCYEDVRNSPVLDKIMQRNVVEDNYRYDASSSCYEYAAAGFVMRISLGCLKVQSLTTALLRIGA